MSKLIPLLLILAAIVIGGVLAHWRDLPDHLPWQEDPASAAARELLEDCYRRNDYGLRPCSRARIERLRYEALEK